MRFDELARKAGEAVVQAARSSTRPDLDRLQRIRRQRAVTAGVSSLLIATLVIVGVVSGWPDPSQEPPIAEASATTTFSPTSTSSILETTTTSTLNSGELATKTIDLLDGSQLEVVGPSELQLTGYLFTIEVPVVRSSNVYLSPSIDPADAAAVEGAGVLESDLGNGIQLWRANREGQPFFMTVDLGGWVALLHVGFETPPDTEFLLSLADDLRGNATENGVVLSNYEVDAFTTYLGDPTTENSIHLGIDQCHREVVPGAEVLEDPTRGEMIRGSNYASWCDAEDLEVTVYGIEEFVQRVLSGLTLRRTGAPSS